DRWAGWSVTDHEDRHAVMVTTPVIDELGEPPTHQYRTGRVDLVYQLSGRPGRPEELPVRTDEPIVQPLAGVAEPVAELIVGAGDVPVERHRHVEHRRRHFRPPVGPHPKVSTSCRPGIAAFLIGYSPGLIGHSPAGHPGMAGEDLRPDQGRRPELGG